MTVGVGVEGPSDRDFWDKVLHKHFPVVRFDVRNMKNSERVANAIWTECVSEQDRFCKIDGAEVRSQYCTAKLEIFQLFLDTHQQDSWLN